MSDLWWTKWHWDRLYSRVLRLSAVSIYPRTSPGGWRICQLVAAVQRHGLTPSTWTRTELPGSGTWRFNTTDTKIWRGNVPEPTYIPKILHNVIFLLDLPRDRFQDTSLYSFSNTCNPPESKFVSLCVISLLERRFLRLYSTEWKDDRWMMNCKGCGRKRSWPNLRQYPGMCLEDWGKPRNSQSIQLICGSRVEPGTWRTRSRIVNRSATTFGPLKVRNHLPRPYKTINTLIFVFKT
jgi:hypothetical protein